MKQLLLEAVRAAHVSLAPAEVPARLAVYFHALERSDHARFAEAMTMLIGLGHRPVDAAGHVAAVDGRTLFVSFDDNYRSWHGSLGLLADLGVTATFYVNSGVFRGDAGPDAIARYFRRVRHPGEQMTLTRAELREIHAAGHAIGCHTHSHPMLSSLDQGLWASEIDRSKQILEDCIGAAVDDFSFPYGMRRHFSTALSDHCAAAGFRTIATGLGGLQHVDPVDAMSIHRTGWKLDRPLDRNLDDLRVDARLFAGATGRSVVG